MTDTRPENCRQRLIDEGKAYPKSGCTACGMSVFTPGFGSACQSGGVALVSREPSQQVRYCIDKLNEQIAPAQAVVDGVCAALELVIPQIEALETLANAPPAPKEEIKLGAIVHLRTKGPNMVVSKVQPDGTWECVWYDHDRGVMNTYAFPEAALNLGVV